MSENLEPLFDRKGKWVGYSDDDVAALDPVRQQLYADVHDTALACEAAELEVKTAQDRVKEAADNVRDAENFLRQHFPPPTHMDLWRESKQTRAHDRGRA